MRFILCLLVLSCICAAVSAVPSYSAPAVVAPAVVAQKVRQPIEVVGLSKPAVAAAEAITLGAGAKVTAAKVDHVNRAAFRQLGLEIGRPLLARRYGELTSLYAASLPPRSLIARIDPVFVRDGKNRASFWTEGSLGLTVV